jgi:hypothetical protein
MIRPPQLQDHLPSCIALCKRGFRLLDLESPMRLLDDRHLGLEQACRTMSNMGECKVQSPLSLHSDTDTRASLSEQHNVVQISDGGLSYVDV